MTRVPTLILSLLIVFSAAAQSPDLRVSIDAPLTARLGDVVTLTATISNAGDSPATNTRASLRIIPGRDCDDHLLLGTIEPGQERVLSCTQRVLVFNLYSLEHTAAVESDNEPRELRHDNFARAFTDRTIDGTDLALWVDLYPTPKPGLPLPLTVHYANKTRGTAIDTRLYITLSEGTFGKMPANCIAEGPYGVCALGSIPRAADPTQWQTSTISFEVIAPDRSEATWSAIVQTQAEQEDEKPDDNRLTLEFTNYRTFFVLEATDAALRRALAEAGASCRGVPCLVAFRIPIEPATKWHTIKLESQLDWLGGLLVEIDGTTQAGYFRDTNPLGPEIEIDGSATTGDGLRVPSRCGMIVRGLALNGFRESAVHVHDGRNACAQDRATVIDGNYIGTDPTGMTAKPNERGIWSASSRGVTATHNVISGNRRTAVYIDHGRGLIANNVIGLNRPHDAPLPNGASGVYVSPNGSGTDVNNNYIGFNAHFGVAIDRRADHVALRGNSFQANGGLAIDWALDGPATGGRTPAPVIRSATYANGVTTIEATAGFGGSFPVVSFYASDAPDPSGHGEGQYFLGESREPYRIVVPQDLRGKWISATLTEVNTLQILRTNDNSGVLRTNTSEMGLAVRVE
ncbi:MAG TPA: right-handed parallel beta-helix repeat-containing protein [Thermoanaerobaculia bacterium]|nr:right-handed parallel beta-helix repeat-containing protein [Thermoanaerobaculia bacterium]